MTAIKQDNEKFDNNKHQADINTCQSAKFSSQSFSTYSTCNEGGNQILLHCSKPTWLILNNSALKIALQLDSGQAPDTIAHHLALKYDIPLHAAKQDVSYVREQLNEKHLLLNQISKSNHSERLPSLNHLLIHITTRCNLKCPHCYINKVSQASCLPPAPQAINKEQAGCLPYPVICRMIDDFAHSGKTITLTGGEPLLHPEFKKIVNYASSFNLKTELLTNGTLINKEWAAFFADKDISIQISIDGSTSAIHDTIRGKGSFDKAVKTVEYLQDAGLGNRIKFCATIMQQNVHDLPNIISLGKKLGVRQVRFLPLRNVGRAEKHWNTISGMNVAQYEQFFDYISELQKDKTCGIDLTCGLAGFLLHIPKTVSDDDFWCSVGKHLVVDINGDIYPCVLMMDDTFKIGNIFSESLSQLIHSSKMAEICDALTSRRNKIAKCASCNWRNFCQSGCMGQALDHKGTIWDTDDFCDYRKRAYTNAFDKILKYSSME